MPFISRRSLSGLLRARDERGSTLVELLAATAIMGTAVVAMLVGITAISTSTAQNRQSTTAGIVARDYAEALDVAVSNAWCAASYTVSYTPPTGYTASVTSIDTCPAASAAQFQKVTITATYTATGKSETLKTVVREP
jgi:type II secretory pathway pseudopilin PulG